ncbi:MAG: GT4 family glycosyltransferase PelF, partial [Verrucomicrobia bacterium]|nr:GT4 family glycosyltransferase PelF [Verrucomicrobiota bacterium]
KHEKKAHCILTEHGVYTNERRIEISMADWIADLHSLDLSLEKSTTTLKQFWYKFFYSMAALCYQSCDAILSTFEGTQQIQKNIGADPKKLKTVVHGINPEQYIPLTKLRTAHPFTVAFIGRMVRIKDVMTYIRACHIVSEKRPDVRFLALGPTTEDPDYFKECLQLISMLGMKEVLQFPGEVDPRAYFPQIDLVVLTSISEVQSLVQLEAGSMGIPAVATNVGAAKEIIDGKEGESPSLGPGGIVTPLVSPEATANAILKFVDDRPFYQTCSAAIAQRIGAYYKLEEEQNFYRELYQSYLKGEK